LGSLENTRRPKNGRPDSQGYLIYQYFGTHLATKADALKGWSGTYCDVKSISINDATGTMLSPTVGILTFKATADGTCYGQKVGPIWGTSVYVKHGDVWEWTFGINLPAHREGA
jgi:hypothetical protein